jgi:hypothetical protein
MIRPIYAGLGLVMVLTGCSIFLVAGWSLVFEADESDVNQVVAMMIAFGFSGLGVSTTHNAYRPEKRVHGSGNNARREGSQQLRPSATSEQNSGPGPVRDYDPSESYLR